uniref:Uncharacterized protein n=1 Tax=Anguilla anguilla TaxID=7936 RepID=A0A0E9X244_ANGAN
MSTYFGFRKTEDDGCCSRKNNVWFSDIHALIIHPDTQQFYILHVVWMQCVVYHFIVTSWWEIKRLDQEIAPL